MQFVMTTIYFLIVNQTAVPNRKIKIVHLKHQFYLILKNTSLHFLQIYKIIYF